MPLLNEPVVAVPTIFKRNLRSLGNRFEISVVADDEDEGWANNCIDAAIDEILRIERLLMSFNNSSQTHLINTNAGIQPVKVSTEIFDIIHRSVKISAATQGSFDITYDPVRKRLFNFRRNVNISVDKKPSKRRMRLINYKNIILDRKNNTVFLKEKGMRIGLGGIEKGYATERAKYILKQNGVESGVVNIAGNVTAWGYQPDGMPWTIGAANTSNICQPFSYLNITDMAVATSVSDEKFAMINNVQYSHTINPKTGLPVHGIKSVTVIGPNAETADAMTIPVAVMGINAGLDMINQTKNIACIIIDEEDKVYTSKNISHSFVKK